MSFFKKSKQTNKNKIECIVQMIDCKHSAFNYRAWPILQGSFSSKVVIITG